MEKNSEDLMQETQDQKADEKSTNRRQFVAGVASLGAAGVLGGAMLSGGGSGQVKSQILSRIQEQLKAEGAEGMIYDKGSHSRYLKESPQPKKDTPGTIPVAD